MTKDEWIYKTARMLKSVLSEIDYRFSETGFRILESGERRALGEALDDLAEIEGELDISRKSKVL